MDARTDILHASLRNRARDLRAAGGACRGSFRKPYMTEMADYLADTYDEAARVLDRRLAEWENKHPETKGGEDE